MKRIWIFNHYATNMAFEKGGRHYYFSRYLIENGYDVTVFCASSIHNSDNSVDLGNKSFHLEIFDNIKFVFIKARNYSGNGIKRLLNIFDYYRGLLKIARKFDKPDVIIASSPHPLSCIAAIKLGRKFGCKNIVEIRDLWPESIVEIFHKSRKNPAIIVLYYLEKRMYAKADALIFTMEGGKDYIIEKGWDKEIPLNKVHYINNGIDLSQFNYNKENYKINDPDLDADTKKVIYMGSIRTANGLMHLVKAAAILNNNNNIRFLIYGEGDQKKELEDYCKNNGINNVCFKGRVKKSYVPYILSKATVEILNYGFAVTNLLKYGGSHNKLFEYLASGKPIISNNKSGYSIIDQYRCGISLDSPNDNEYAQAIMEICELNEEKYNQMCNNAITAAKEYDFKELSSKLISLIDSLSKGQN